MYSLQRPDPIDYPDNPTPDPTGKPFCLAFLFEEQPKKALGYLQKARDFGSRSTDISLWEGVSYERLGEVDKAKEAYAQAARLLKGDLRPMVMSGLMLAEAGRCEEARPLLINAGKRGAVRAPALQKAIQICGL